MSCPVRQLRELAVNLVDQLARAGQGGTEEVLACHLENVEESTFIALHHHADQRSAVKLLRSLVNSGHDEVQPPGRLVKLPALQSRATEIDREVPDPTCQVRDVVQPRTPADHLGAVGDVLLVSFVRVDRPAHHILRTG